MRERRAGGTIRTILAWSGLHIMALCVIWLQLLPPAQSNTTTRRSIPSAENALGLVIIDPGHGGRDSGAVRNGILEKDLTLDVARRLEQLARGRGWATMLTRRSDEFVSLAGRAAAANRKRDCVFVSIHFDEGKRAEATGVQTFYAVRQVPKTSAIPSWLPFLQPAAAEGNTFDSQSLAGFVQSALVTRTQAFNRGTRAEQFYVVANVRHPAVLVEGGFLSNDGDVGKLTTEAYRQELAAAITEGIVRYREIASQRQATLAVGSVGSE